MAEKRLKSERDLDPKDPNVYQWEDVLEKRTVKGDVQYLIKWAGWSDEHNTWESVSTLTQEVVDFYENEVAPLLRRRYEEPRPSTSSTGGPTTPGSSSQAAKGMKNGKRKAGQIDNGNDRNGEGGMGTGTASISKQIRALEPEYFIGKIGKTLILGPRTGNPYIHILNYIPETKIVIEVMFPQRPKQIRETELSYMVKMKDINTGDVCAAYIHHRILMLAYPWMIIELYEKNTAFYYDDTPEDERMAIAMEALRAAGARRAGQPKKEPYRDRVPLIEDTSSSSQGSASDDSDTVYEEIDIAEDLRKRLLKDEENDTDSD